MKVNLDQHDGILSRESPFPASLLNNLSKYIIQEYALEVDKESKVHHHFNLLAEI